MRTVPPGLMAAVLLLWGWQTHSWMFALILIALSEGSRLIRFRMEISVEYLIWLSDLSAVLLILTAIYLFLDRQGEQFVYLLLRYLPLIVSPIFLAQILSVSGKTDIRAISVVSRRSRPGKEGKPRHVCLEYPFLTLVLLSAAFSPEKNAVFYPLFVLIAALGLLNVRSRRYSAMLWLGILLIPSCLGFAAHVGLNKLQLYLEGKGTEWFSDSDFEDSDLFRSTTAIGNIGELKPSSRILFRVRPKNREQLPILLREAAYDWFSKNEWFAVRPEFASVGQSEKEIWTLGKRSRHPRQITILTSFRKGKGVLRLPSGTFRILDLPAVEMSRNRFGAVRVEGVPDYAEYEAEYGEGISEDSPTERDMQVPDEDMPIAKETTNMLGLRTLSPQESALRLKTFFETNFTYSLSQKPSKHSGAIRQFLQVSRSGHCEYFATAGTLLLRAAGIPARYAVGFSVHEQSPMEKYALVRTRHAHAWTLAWIDGRWTEWDFTPSVWRESESQSVSGWNRVSDMWDYLVFGFRQWWWRKQDRSIYTLWLIVPLILILGRRLLLIRKKRQRKEQAEKEETIPAKDRPPSPFDEVTNELLRKGYVRLPGETLKTWIDRIRHRLDIGKPEVDLLALLNLHYRLRFDPLGITPEQYRSLEQGSRSWCAAIVGHSP